MFVSKIKYDQMKKKWEDAERAKDEYFFNSVRKQGEINELRKEVAEMQDELRKTKDFNASLWTELTLFKEKYTAEVQKNFELAKMLEDLKEKNKNPKAESKKYWSRVCTICGYRTGTNTLFSNCPKCGAKVEEHR